MSKNNFLKGAAILAIAGVLVKVIGALYRIPLGNIMPEEGMGYYGVSYQVYVLLVAISTSGFPTATSKIIAEKRAYGDYSGAHKIFKVSFIGFLIAGIFSSLVVLFGAKTILGLMDNLSSYYALLALIPALLFVPIMSAFRGYFQGMQDMVPTAVSQLIEQIFRAATTITLAYILLNTGDAVIETLLKVFSGGPPLTKYYTEANRRVAIAAGGASFGASAGAVGGTIIMALIYFKNRKKIMTQVESTKGFEEETSSKIIKSILYIAIPITIGASIVPIINAVDATLVSRILQQIGYTEKEALGKFGQISQYAQTLINFPQVLSVAMAMSLVPSISDAFSRRDQVSIRKTTNSGIRTTLLISLPAAVGLFVLAKPIIGLIYYSKTDAVIAETGQILAILAISLVFLTLVQSLTAILQGIGKPMVPVKNLAVGAIAKIVLTYTLVRIPGIEVKGAAISTVVTYVIAAALNLYGVKKYTNVEIKVIDTILKPVLAAGIMGVAVKIAYSLGLGIVGSKLSTVVSIAIGALVYGVAILAVGGITTEDLQAFPKGEKIAKLLKRIGLLRK